MGNENYKIARFGQKVEQFVPKVMKDMLNEGRIDLNMAIQRSVVWTKEQKSLFIHSMIIGVPINPFHAVVTSNEDGEDIYHFIDGKQRLSTYYSYMNDEFALVDVPDVLLTNGEYVNVGGLKFSELPEAFQEYLIDKSLWTVWTIVGIKSEEDISDIFYRLNNGKQLSSIEKQRVKAPSLLKIQEIAKHPVIAKALSEKAFAGYKDEEVVTKCFMILKQDDKSLENKAFKEYITELILTDKDAALMNLIYDRMNSVYDFIKENENLDAKIRAKVTKRMLTRTHFISLIPLFEHCDDLPKLAGFLYRFFGTKSTSIRDDYNAASRSGSSSASNVETRLKALNDEWQKYSKEYKQAVTAVTEASKHDKSTNNNSDATEEKRISMQDFEDLMYEAATLCSEYADVFGDAATKKKVQTVLGREALSQCNPKDADDITELMRILKTEITNETAVA